MIAFDAYNAPRIIYGEGVSKQVATLLQSLNVKTVMAVYDEGIKQVGIADSPAGSRLCGGRIRRRHR